MVARFLISVHCTRRVDPHHFEMSPDDIAELDEDDRVIVEIMARRGSTPEVPCADCPECREIQARERRAEQVAVRK